MSNRKSLIALALLSIAPQSFASTCPQQNVASNPELFQWIERSDHYYGVLEIGEKTFTIGSDTITTRAYRQAGGSFSIPGPTIVMFPDNKYVLSFHNRLPHETASEEHNVFKDPNISNLHTHGLHISGESPSDDVTRFFEGGSGGDFVYDIPADHMGGTYWYHAHHHGSTFLQVSGGAFGLIIIDDSGDGIPANVAAMKEKHLVFGFLDPDAAGTGGDTLIEGTLSPSWTVNGKVDANVCVPANEWQHWRTLIADRDAREKTITIGANCKVALLARDGVWRTKAPKDLPTNSVTMTGASRADLAVRCSGDSTISVDNQVVASIYADGQGDSGPQPYAADGVSEWSADRPHYLRDLRGVPGSINTETVSMGARTINGDKFDIDVPSFELPADQVQEWTVKGATQHPFHLHIYHMQMMTDCKNYEGGEYYDVIATNCDVRFDLNAGNGNPAHVYDGRTIMHCHILAHEDQGAMTWMDVIGGDDPPTFPAGHGYSYSVKYELVGPGAPPAAPTGLMATAVSASQIELAWIDNSTDEDGFAIQRSMDGSNFGPPTSVPRNTTGYEDTGLIPATTYFYRVTAFNSNGDSAYSNVADATTLDDGTPALTVDSVTVSTVNQGRGQKAGLAVVVISDGQGTLVQGATVNGYFTGTFNEPDKTRNTDVNGTATIDTDGTAKGGISLTFCVTSVTHTDYVNFSGEFCGSL